MASTSKCPSRELLFETNVDGDETQYESDEKISEISDSVKQMDNKDNNFEAHQQNKNREYANEAATENKNVQGNVDIEQLFKECIRKKHTFLPPKSE